MAGSLLFAADQLVADRDQLVRVGPAEVEMLEARWLAQTGTLATPAERKALIEGFVEEEVLSREALRLGLDRGDTIIRRRLAQKMKLILREQVQPLPVGPEDVQAFIDQNPGLFIVPRRVAFRQVFLGPEADDTFTGQVLADLADKNDGPYWQQAGLASMLPAELGLSSEAEIAGLFGREFAARLLAGNDEGGWWGPLRSAYGVHLVMITEMENEHVPGFDTLRLRAEDMLRRQRAEMAELEAWAELLSRYVIEMDTRDP